jgi:SnoaL-like domain
MERSESNFLFRAYVFANASAAWRPLSAVALGTSQWNRMTPGVGGRKGFDVMNTQELAKAFTDMCAKGELEAAGKKFWSDDVVSREPMTGDMAELKGRKAVEGKTQWWNANHEVHDLKVEGPYVHGDQFVVRFKLDVTPKGQKRVHLDEVGLYTVRNSRIVEESFFMGGR